jgi:hypothetical protein
MRLERITQGTGREGSKLGLQRSNRQEKKHNWPIERFERIRHGNEGKGSAQGLQRGYKNNREAT